MSRDMDFVQDLGLCATYLRECGLEPVCDRRVANALQHGVPFSYHEEFCAGPAPGGSLSEDERGPVGSHLGLLGGVPILDDGGIAQALEQDPRVVWISLATLYFNLPGQEHIEKALVDGRIVGRAVMSPLSGTYFGLSVHEWHQGQPVRYIRGFSHGIEGSRDDLSFASYARTTPATGGGSGTPVGLALFEWARANMPRIVHVRRLGLDCHVPWLDTPQRRHSLFEVIENRRSAPVHGETFPESIRLRLAHLASQPPFDVEARRRELLARLAGVPGLEVPPDALRAREYLFPLAQLQSRDTLDGFIAVIDWAVDQMRAAS